MLVEATPGANGVLALVNDPSTTFELLDDDVGLDKRAARGLFEGRPYDSIKEMDAVKWVGGRALDDHLAFVDDRQTVGKLFGFLHMVCHVQDGHTVPPAELL